MPVYEYTCPVHKEFEVEHSINEKLKTCPKCKEEGLKPQKVTRLISGGTTFVLNGDCWAKDNYK